MGGEKLLSIFPFHSSMLKETTNSTISVNSMMKWLHDEAIFF